MANTYTSLLNTAGIAPDGYGLDVMLDAANKSVMMPLVRRYNVPRGNSLYAPIVGTRSVTSRARGATTETAAVSFTALNDTGASFTKAFNYDALEIGYASLNDLDAPRLAAWLNAEKAQMGAALANQLDADLLGLYASASDSVGGTGQDVTYDLLVEAIRKLRVANAPGPYFVVLPETQWDHLAKIDQLVRADVRGPDGAINRQMFSMFGVQIFCTNNVPTSGGLAHGLAFSGEGILLALRDMVEVKEWDEPNNTAVRVMAYSDYAYANSFTDYIVDFQTTDS